MTEPHKAALFITGLCLFMALLLATIISSAGPIVLGTECRTAGRNGDQLFLGQVDCGRIERE